MAIMTEQRCCVCPLCPVASPQCFATRKTLLQHVREEKEDPAGGKHSNSIEDYKLPSDEDLEWVQAVKLVYQRKMRWIRTDRASGISELQSIGPDNFRMKSKFERATGLLEKHGA